jgi:hypothetical protein
MAEASSVPADGTDRALEAARRSLPKLPGEARYLVSGMLKPESVTAMGGVIGLWAGSHLVGVGELADVLLLGTAVAALGSEGLRAVREFGSYWKVSQDARASADLDRAANHFATAVAIVGVNGLIALLTKRAARGAAVEMSAARWARYTESLDFVVAENRGALWSQLGDKGELAGRLAQRDGLTTLEQSLSRTDFFKRYKAEFGSLDAQTPLTGRVWEMLSRKFASNLKGRVVAYVDDPALIKTIQGGRLPQLTAELESIADVMEANPKISSVVLKDIFDGPSAVMTREMVLRAANLSH